MGRCRKIGKFIYVVTKGVIAGAPVAAVVIYACKSCSLADNVKEACVSLCDVAILTLVPGTVASAAVVTCLKPENRRLITGGARMMYDVAFAPYTVPAKTLDLTLGSIETLVWGEPLPICSSESLSLFTTKI